MVKYGQDNVPAFDALCHLNELLKAPFAQSVVRRENRDRDFTIFNGLEKDGADVLTFAKLIFVSEHADSGINEAVVEVIREYLGR